MKRLILWMLPLVMGGVCHAEDITIRYNGAKAIVKQQTKDSVSVTVDGASVTIMKDKQYTVESLHEFIYGKYYPAQ